MNKLLYVFVVSLFSFFQASGTNKGIIQGAQYYAIFNSESEQIEFRKALGKTVIPFDDYRGTKPRGLGNSKEMIGFFNADGQLICSEESEKIECTNYTKILTAAMLKLDPKVKKPIATFARLFECKDHGRAIKLFDNRHFELGCFTYNDHPVVEKLAQDLRISKYIDLSQLKAHIEVDYTEINDCGSAECTIL